MFTRRTLLQGLGAILLWPRRLWAQPLPPSNLRVNSKYMAIVRVQQTSGAFTPDTSTSINYVSAPTEGNLLVAAVFARPDNLVGPSGWSTAVFNDDAGNGDELAIFYKTAGAAESSTVT